MATDGSDLAQRLGVVERARGGDHSAFVDLYRQDAPPAWRLALALTGDGDRAADAVARAFSRTLAPLPPGAAQSEVPCRQRLLTATREVVVDQAAASSRGRAPLAVVPAPVEDGVEGKRSSRGVEVMHAFHQLPERWRSVLWLVLVEGLGTAEAASVLRVDAGTAEELLLRAHAGLRTQWIRDRRAEGRPPQAPPEHLEQHLQPLLPLPLDLFAITEGRWRAARTPPGAPLLLVLPLPGGRTLPRWAERGLLASTAALIALGITSALAIDRDPDVERARRGDTAAGPTSATVETPGHGGAGEPVPIDDSIDAIDAVAPIAANDKTTAPAHRHADSDSRQVVAASTATATPSGSTTTTSPPPTTSTTAEPLLEVAAGIGPDLALSLGDQCIGLQVGAQTLGCKPEADAGVTAEGTLVPGG